MRHVDIAVVGGGLAGSMAAAMLGRAGMDALLIDPHEAYPPDFRCEKLDRSQVALLRKTGLADAILGAAALDGELTVARFGRVIDRKPNAQYGILYDELVNTARAQIPAGTAILRAKAAAMSASAGRQEIRLSTGEEISARLIVLANGLNSALRQSLGMGRREISACHSIGIGFNVAPAGGADFGFRALTYFPERGARWLAYISLFPIPSGLRANMFVYRGMQDLWLREMRHAPAETLLAALPGLGKLLRDFEIVGPVQIRPVDLYRTTNLRRPGVVAIGDAFATSCPAAGTGVNKVLTDVERLCSVYVPEWLSTAGMGAAKVARFYEDPVKQACDRHSEAKAHRLRALSTEAGFAWSARRWGKFLGHFGMGRARDARSRLSVRLPRARQAALGSTPTAQ